MVQKALIPGPAAKLRMPEAMPQTAIGFTPVVYRLLHHSPLHSEHDSHMAQQYER